MITYSPLNEFRKRGRERVAKKDAAGHNDVEDGQQT